MSEWLIGVTCAAMLAAVACCLMPPGGVRQVGGLVCAMMLAWAVLKPIAPLLDGLEAFDITMGAEGVQAELEENSGQMLKSIIEQECGTYIVDKAAELGADCRVSVICEADGDGVWLPEGCQVFGQLTMQQRESLERIIQSDLGIAPQQQRYTGGE